MSKKHANLTAKIALERARPFFASVSAFGLLLVADIRSAGDVDDAGPQCPCSNYTTFPEFGKNNVMEACASKVGLNWTALHACGTGPMGQALMAQSSTTSNHHHVTYGADGLAPIYVDGIMVKTKKLIPIVCGPVPDEVQVAVCFALKQKGATPPACSGAAAAGD